MKRGRAESARWRGRRVVKYAHERIALEANYAGALWVAGSSCLPVNSPRASIGPLCHCQYSKELQIIWWLMVHSRTHWIYGCSAAKRADLNRYNARFLLRSLILRCFLLFRLFRPFEISLSDPRWFLLFLLESSLISSCPFHVTGILSCVSSAAIVPLFFSPVFSYRQLFVSFLFLFLSLSLVLISYFRCDTFIFSSCLFLYVAATGAILFLRRLEIMKFLSSNRSYGIYSM